MITEENIQSTLKLPQIYLGINWYHYLVGNTGYYGRLNFSNLLLWLQEFLDIYRSWGCDHLSTRKGLWRSMWYSMTLGRLLQINSSEQVSLLNAVAKLQLLT